MATTSALLDQYGVYRTLTLVREIQEEIGVTIEVLSEYFRVEHSYPTRTVQLFFFESRILSGTPQALHVADLRWVRPSELEQFSFPEADLELIARLKR